MGYGIAVDDEDNLLVATSALDIQFYNSGSLTPSLFAAFDTWVEELTFDSQGHLYVLEGTSSGGDSAMILRVSPVPEPATIILLGSGLLGLAGLARKRIRKE